MKLTKSIRISWRAISNHKLRAALTTMGIVIGIASVIVFMVMGSGFLAAALSDVETEEDHLLRVQTQLDADTGFGWQIQTAPIYTESDIDALEEIEGVEWVAPDGWLTGSQFAYENETVTGGFSIRATIPERMSAGDFELDGEVYSAANQAVINTQTAERFEPAIEPGDELSVTFEGGSAESFTVTGVVDDGDSGFVAQPVIYMQVDPHYTARVETPDGTTERAYPFLDIRVANLDDRASVQNVAREFLRSESHAAELNQNGEIRVLTREDQIERFEDVIDDITLFVVSIAGIALVVGSIGIANIMFVSVTERRREIGIMKAVGARKRDIMQLFVVESLLLGALGAVLGLLFGLGIGFLLVWLLGWQMAYPITWIGGAVVVGLVVGVLAGIYPAWRAARVDPIEALRQE